MAQPPAYSPVTSFTTYQAQQSWFPGQQLDVEFNALHASITAIDANLKLIQRDDGALANGSVDFSQLSTSLLTALSNIGVAVPISTILTQPNTWTGLQTFSAGIATPQLPHLTTSVQGTGFPGMDGASGGVNWFLWNAPLLTDSNAAAPTLRIDRAASGTGGSFGNTVPTLWVNTTTAAGDSNFSWGILSQLLNNSTTAAQQVAVAAFATRALGATSPTFGGNISASDNNSTANPTVGLVGLEVDCGVGNALNGGTDVNANRVILNLAAGGGSGSHVGHGLRMSGLAGVVVDRGITYRPGCSFVVGLDFVDATISTAPIFLPASAKIVFDGSWSGQTPSFNRSLFYNGAGSLIYKVGALQAVLFNDLGACTLASNLVLNGSSSGALTQAVQAAAGTPTVTWGTGSGTPAVSAVNDTNVTLTLSSATGALTAGWQSTLAVARGGTGLGSGTSGGVPYFSTTSTLASSALLAANAIVVGGGAGAAPLTQPTTPPTVSSTGVVAVVNTTASSSATTGALQVAGGVGIANTSVLQTSAMTNSILFGSAVGATTYGAISMNGTLTPANMSGFFSGGGGDNSFYFTSPAASSIQFQTANATYATFNSGGISAGVPILINNGASGLGYTTGAGGAVTQATSRTTGVTLNKISGDITLVSAAAITTFQSFVVSNTVVGANDTVVVTQKSGTDKYQIFVTNVTGATSFTITFATTGGTTTEQPVFHFNIIKGAIT